MFWYRDPNINTYQIGRPTNDLEKVYLKDVSKPLLQIFQGGDHVKYSTNGSVWSGQDLDYESRKYIRVSIKNTVVKYD